jgi:hypothetical protein
MKLKVPKAQVHRTLIKLNNSKGEVHYPRGFPDEFDRLLRSLHQVDLILNACPKPLTWQRIVRLVLYHGLLIVPNLSYQACHCICYYHDESSH